MALIATPKEPVRVSWSKAGDAEEKLWLTDPGLGLGAKVDFHGYRQRAGQWMPLNGVTAAYRLVEELGEASGALGKGLHHRFDNHNPKTGELNIDWLHREINDVLTTYILLRCYQQKENENG